MTADPTSMRRARRRGATLALVSVVVALLSAGLASAQTAPPDPLGPPATFSESAGVQAPDGSAPVDRPSSSTPALTSDQVQLSELVKLGLLLMEPKAVAGPGVAPVAAPVVDPTPWAPPYKTGPTGESPVVTPPGALGPGDGTVYAVGDSVLLGTERWLGSTLGGWDLRLDARVSRRFPEGLDILRKNQASVGQVVVICLGHNYGGGGFAQSYVDEAIALSSRAQRIVFVTQTEWTPAQAEVNRAIYTAAARNPKVVVAPWAETIKANPQFLVDNVHPNTGGAVALANLVAVMVGPAPARTGQAPPRPVILPIPNDPRPTPTPTAPPIGPPTTPPSVTTTSVPRPTSTSTPAPTSTTAAPTTTAPVPTSSTPPP
jgi:lysophospholipase L1-like esterase